MKRRAMSSLGPRLRGDDEGCVGQLSDRLEGQQT